MKVKCIANTGEDLSEKTIAVGQLKTTEYDINIEKIYTVYSMHMWKGILSYLLSDELNDWPFWYPAELFEVVDPLLPMEWYFSFNRYENKEPRNAIWGYKEMALDPQHRIDLIERETEALEIFFKRKKEIDEYEELSKFIPKKS